MSHHFMACRAECVPVGLVVLMATTMTACFILSIVNGHVTPYLPFVSETGAFRPESGIFTAGLLGGCILAGLAMYMRYWLVRAITREDIKSIACINVMALVLGYMSTVGMLVVAAYPMSGEIVVHNGGALMVFLCGVLYMILQTVISYKMAPEYNARKIAHVRLLLTFIATLCFVSTHVLFSIGILEWKEGKYHHTLFLRSPTDQGFELLLISSASEWSLSLAFLFFFLTFAREFQKMAFNTRVWMLVSHLEQEPTYPLSEITPFLKT